jgi:hypothetical protein
VTDGLALLGNGNVRLIVPAATHRIIATANLEIVLREVEVLRIAGDAIELCAVPGINVSDWGC